MKDQGLIDKLYAKMQEQDKSAPALAANTNGNARHAAMHAQTALTDQKVLQLLFAEEKRGREFEDVYNGNYTPYHPSPSEAIGSLLWRFAFYTGKDPAQMERLIRGSALPQQKFDTRRKGTTWLGQEITRAVEETEEVYTPLRARERPMKASGLADLSYIGKSTKSADEDGGDDLDYPKLSLVRFAGRPVPAVREFIIPDLLPRYHPTTLYGWGGTAKSLIAALLAMSVAGRREKFFERTVAVHGAVLYVDFELDADEQHRRVNQLAVGLGTEVPQDLLYVSALGARTNEAISFALSVCEEYQVVMVVLDSLGPAMVGDMAAAKDVIEFHNCYIAPFREIGVTPLLIDHQARQQGGEGYQSKGAFGSAYKEHLSRSLIQVEAGDRSAEQGTLNIRLRHKKTNFGALCDPFDVALTFSAEEISASVRELTPADRAQETTLNATDRVEAALEDGPAYPDELVESTGLARSTIKNELNKLKKAGRVEKTGETKGQMEQVRLADSRTRPIKEKSAKSTAPDEALPGGQWEDVL